MTRQCFTSHQNKNAPNEPNEQVKSIWEVGDVNSRVITHMGEETLKRVREGNLTVRLSHDGYVGRLGTAVSLRVT